MKINPFPTKSSVDFIFSIVELVEKTEMKLSSCCAKHLIRNAAVCIYSVFKNRF